ncbi:MAG: hypothetical protein ABI232_02680 [Jatrophihabitantaceae bacterium]
MAGRIWYAGENPLASECRRKGLAGRAEAISSGIAIAPNRAAGALVAADPAYSAAG